MNSQDRELLELAAKAAGYVVEEDRSTGGLIAKQGFLNWHPWNPLEDDGDAFRLAFALKVPIWYWCNGTIESMRRAIVSIAAKGPF